MPGDPASTERRDDEDDAPLVDKLARRALGRKGRIPRRLVVPERPPARRARLLVLGAAAVAFFVFFGTTFNRQLDRARKEAECERGSVQACIDLCRRQKPGVPCKEVAELCRRGEEAACAFTRNRGSSR